MRKSKKYPPNPVSLESFRAEFAAYQFLIKKAATLPCLGSLPKKELAMVYRFDNTYHILAEEALDLIWHPYTDRAKKIMQQSDDLATAIWRWYYNRRLTEN